MGDTGVRGLKRGLFVKPSQYKIVRVLLVPLMSKSIYSNVLCNKVSPRWVDTISPACDSPTYCMFKKIVYLLNYLSVGHGARFAVAQDHPMGPRMGPGLLIGRQ